MLQLHKVHQLVVHDARHMHINTRNNIASRVVTFACFWFRYVANCQVEYIQKTVSSGEETVSALKKLGDSYALLVVGKGGRGQSHMTTGLSDWEECPELGTVGDLLASSDFDISSSVLVIQQHKQAQKRLHGI